MAVGTIGKYERLDVLGHGTSGVVYLAWDTLLRRNVALKEIRADGEETERVLEEARVLERLRGHPHIVGVNSVNVDAGVILIDMELVRGRNLSDVLKAQPGVPLSPAEAVRIAIAVLDALGFAHEKRIIHRDIKPANILIGDDGIIKLTDFGLAEALGTGSLAGGGGTYPYMAPEDFAEDAASDYRADLWAVGVVLYEMLTGRRPFTVARPKDPFQWMRAIQNEVPPRPSTLAPGIAPALDTVVERALAKDKAARYPTAAIFADALRAAVAVAPVVPPTRASARPITLGEPDTMPGEFIFAGGASVAYTLDELRAGAAKHWNEGRAGLMNGRFEAFLREIGEVYIADLAHELQNRQSESADKLLREFLDRSRPDEEESDVLAPVEDATLPFVKTAPDRVTAPSMLPAPVPLTRRERARQVKEARRQEKQERQEKKQRKGKEEPEKKLVAVAASGDVPAKPARPSFGWFFPLFVAALAPALVSMVLRGDWRSSQMGRYNDLEEAWAITGILSAMLLLIGVGAKWPAALKTLCFIPAGVGLICLGTMVSQVAQGLRGPEALPIIGVTLLAPVLILIVQALTVVKRWQIWACLIVAVAALAAGHFAVH